MTSALKVPIGLRFFFDAKGAQKLMLETLSSLPNNDKKDPTEMLLGLCRKYIRPIDPTIAGLTNIYHGREQTNYELTDRIVSVFIESTLYIPLTKMENWINSSNTFGDLLKNDNKLLFMTLYVVNYVSNRRNVPGLHRFTIDDIPDCPEKKPLIELIQWFDDLSEPSIDTENVDPNSEDVKNNLNSSLSIPKNADLSLVFDASDDNDTVLTDETNKLIEEKFQQQVNKLEAEKLKLSSDYITLEEQCAALEKTIKIKDDQCTQYRRMKVFVDDQLRETNSDLNRVKIALEKAQSDAATAQNESNSAKVALSALEKELEDVRSALSDLTKLYETAKNDLNLAKTVVHDCRRQMAAGDAEAPEIIVLREKISTYESRLTTLTTTIKESKFCNAEAEKLIEKLEKECAEFNHQSLLKTREVEKCQNRIEELQVLISVAMDDKLNAEARVKEVESELAMTTKMFVTVKEEKRDLLVKLGDRDDEVKSLTKRSEDDKQCMIELKEKNRCLTHQQTGSEELIKTLTGIHEESELENKRLKKEIKDVVSENKIFQSKIQFLNGQLDDKYEEADCLRNERDSLASKASGFHRSFNTSNVRREELEETLASRQADIDVLQRKVNRLESRLEVEREKVNEIQAELMKSLDEKKVIEKEVAVFSSDHEKIVADKKRLEKALDKVNEEVDAKMRLLADKEVRIENLSVSIRRFKDITRKFENEITRIRAEVADLYLFLSDFMTTMQMSFAKVRKDWIDMHQTLDTSRRHNMSLELELNEVLRQQLSRTPSLHEEFSLLGLPTNEEIAFDDAPDSGNATAVSSPEVTPRDPSEPIPDDDTRDIDAEVVVLESLNASNRNAFPTFYYLAVLMIFISIVLFACFGNVHKFSRYFRLKYEVVGFVPT